MEEILGSHVFLMKTKIEISNILENLKKHKFSFISETVIEWNGQNFWITYMVNDHSITFFNISKFKIFHLGICMHHFDAIMRSLVI